MLLLDVFMERTVIITSCAKYPCKSFVGISGSEDVNSVGIDLKNIKSITY